MATPQWVLLQRRIEPSRKISESQYERNAKKRQIQEVRTAAKRGYLKHLDQSLILESDPGVQELDHVTYISLPYYSIQSVDELSMLSCPRLTIVNLPSNFITDISAFHSCINLLKLDVSGNRIQVLPCENSFWSSLLSLKILYLNNNIISDKKVLLSLNHCSSLQILTMYDNPVALLSNYRHMAVNCILSLKALDHHVISDQEIIENIQLAGKFRARAKPFHRLLYLPVNKDHTLETELREVYKLLLSVDTVLAHHSPVLIIQRWVRGWLTRNRILKSNNSELKTLVRYRQKGSDHIKKFLKESIPILPLTWLDSGRIRTADLPFPPPSSPMPLTPYSTNRLPIALATTEPTGDKTDNINHSELQKTIKETKKILSEGNVHEAKKIKSIPTKKCKKDIVKPPMIKEKDEVDCELAIQGEHQEVTEINKLDFVKEMKMRDAQEIREAENDIKDLILKTRKPVEQQPKMSCWPKDTHTFIRGHATMSLAMLKQLNREQYVQQKGNELSKKAKIVAKVREERELKKKRIFQNKQNLKDAIITWKLGEEKLLREKKALMELEDEEKRIKKAENIESMIEVVKNRKEKEKLALIFAQQHNMMDKRLHKAERKLQKVYMEDIYKEKVQSSRLSAQEQAEVVNKFMELRQEKMRSENNEEREKLNSLMIELASQKMMETKQKVAKVKAWKKVAKSLEESDPLYSTNVPKNDLSTAFDSIPEADAVDVGILGPLLQAYANIGMNNIPLQMRGITHQSHRTWQRGCIEIMKHTRNGGSGMITSVRGDQFDHHLPRLKPVSDLQPLMYDQLPPPPYFHHIGTTPDNTYQTNTPVLEVGGIIDNSMSFPEPPEETLHPMTPAQSGRPFTSNVDHYLYIGNSTALLPN